MKRYEITLISLSTLLVLLAGSPVFACPVCRRQVEATIDAPDYTANLIVLVFPVLLILLMSVGLYHAKRLKDGLSL